MFDVICVLIYAGLWMRNEQCQLQQTKENDGSFFLLVNLVVRNTYNDTFNSLGYVPVSEYYLKQMYSLFLFLLSL